MIILVKLPLSPTCGHTAHKNIDYPTWKEGKGVRRVGLDWSTDRAGGMGSHQEKIFQGQTNIEAAAKKVCLVFPNLLGKGEVSSRAGPGHMAPVRSVRYTNISPQVEDLRVFS